MQMKAQAAQLRIAGSLSKSTEVMKSMQQLVKLPEIQQTMMEMSKEMCKVSKNKQLFAQVKEDEHKNDSTPTLIYYINTYKINTEYIIFK